MKRYENQDDFCTKACDIVSSEQKYAGFETGGSVMAGTVATGCQQFDRIIENHGFYVDKTGFIKDWWENLDEVTLITRPRRFGKT